MTFLNPLVLLGLAAAAIPIILHLIHLRKLRIIEFSTLSFLKELQKTKIRRLKLRQLLLLILRMLLVILIVLAFARPTLKGHFAAESRAQTTAVLILDDSYSMTASDEEGEYIGQAKDAALNIVSLLKEGDDVYVVPLSTVGRDGTPDPTPIRDMAVVRSVVGDLHVTSIHRHLEDGLLLAGRVLSRSRNFNKEVFLISDFQEGSVIPNPSNRKVSDVQFDPDARIFFLPIGKKEVQNFGIKSAIIQNSIIESNKSFTLDLALGNFSSTDARNYLVSIFLNGSRVSQRGIDLPAGQIVRSEFSLIPRSSGFLEGMIELEDDDLLYDNRFYFSLHLPERLRVLLVGTDADTRYLSIALATRTGESSTLKIERAQYNRVTASMITNEDVVILTNPNQESTPFLDLLAGFVSNGGGLLLFPGPKTGPATFNKAYAPLNIPTLSQVETISGGSATFVEIEKAELRHPLFEGMFERSNQQSAKTEARSLETPRIHTLARFNPGTKALPVIALSNGAPFLLEQRSGSGRMLIACIPATLEWSDFPLKGLFVPLVHRSLSYLTQEQVRQPNLFAGDPVVVKLSDPRVRASVETPQGVDAAIARPSGSNSSVMFSETLQPGVYTVRENASPVSQFTVNVDPDESKTARADAQSVGAMTNRVGIDTGSITTIDQPASAEQIVLQSRFGIELWKYFLIVALVIAVAEMIIARDSGRDVT